VSAKTSSRKAGRRNREPFDGKKGKTAQKTEKSRKTECSHSRSSEVGGQERQLSVEGDREQKGNLEKWEWQKEEQNRTTDHLAEKLCTLPRRRSVFSLEPIEKGTALEEKSPGSGLRTGKREIQERKVH